MADLQVGNIHGVAARGGKNINGGDDARDGYDDADLLTVAAKRARLAAINGTLYTEAYMNTMTHNDMVYAIRQADAAGTL